jgi:transposase
MTNYKEILRLHSMGINNTRIAESCSCARSTVISTIQKAAALGLQWSELKDFSETETARKLYPETAGGRGYKMPDYEFIHREMQKSGVTLSLLWVEYCEQCRAAGEIPYQSTQFNKYYAEYVHKTRATMHLEHKPGETMQVDWAGQTAGFRDTDTGEIIHAHLLVSVLPYSGYAYVEAFSDKGRNPGLKHTFHAYAFYGGSTRILTPITLKTGIVKNTKMISSSTARTAKWLSTMGPRLFRPDQDLPKDKAFVEGSVGVVSTWIIAALRNRQFFSLAELNEAIGERLYAFNHKPFQKKDGSRAKTFEEEKPFLLQLPSVPFELAEWKIATVQYNYHISADKQNYSVPYEYIKQRVDVRLTSHTVEVFFEGNRIASHPRLYGRPNQYSTLEMHMPPDHQQYLQWTGDRFIRWAEQIGPNDFCRLKLFLTQQGGAAGIQVLHGALKTHGQVPTGTVRKRL